MALANTKKSPYVAPKAAPKPPAISTKVPAGMTMADYGRQIYSAQNPSPAPSSGSGGSSSPSYGNYVNTYGNEGYANLIRAKEAAGQQLDDRSAADLFKANNPTLFGVQPIQPEVPQQPNLVDMARQQANQEQAAALARMQAARAKATGELTLQKQGVNPAYNQLRNQSSASTMQAAQRLREMMAANGLGQSGENVSAQVALGAQGGQALNDLNLQEKARLNEIDQGIANVNNADEEAAIIAQLSAEKTRAMMDATARQSDLDYRNKQFDENVRQFGVTSNRAELQRQAEQRSLLATMLGVDPVTGKQTVAKTTADAKIANIKADNARQAANAAKSSSTKTKTPVATTGTKSMSTKIDQAISEGAPIEEIIADLDELESSGMAKINGIDVQALKNLAYARARDTAAKKKSEFVSTGKLLFGDRPPAEFRSLLGK